MKIRILILSISIIIATAFSDNIKKNPPGTELVKGLNYYVDQQVITIGDWKEFCFFVKNESGLDSANKMLPDSNVIISHYGTNIYTNGNNKNSLTKNYSEPIVGVSFAQIEAYCVFRTKAVNMTRKKNKSEVIYMLLDHETEEYLLEHTFKNISKLHSNNLPEVIKINGETPVYRLPKDSKNKAFSFRCIAKTK